MESVILVPFEGEGSGTADLTWGQLEIWLAMGEQESSLAMGGVMPVPPGVTADHAALTLRYIMSRHQSLRTLLLFDPEADGGVRQVLHSSGEAQLRIVDVEDGEDPGQVAAALLERLSNKKFDYVAEWPVRMAVVRQNGIATHSIVVYCHIALDAFGLQALLTDLARLDYATGAFPPPGDVPQPMDQLRWQQEPEGVRHHESTVSRWRRQLVRVPARRFGDTADERTPRYWHARYDSPAAFLATRLICERTRADVTAVALAAAAVELARITGIGPSVLQTVVHNRFRPGLAEVVGPVAQTGLCVLDVEACTFDDVVAKAWRASIQAYMNSYYNPVRLNDAIARFGADRGAEIDMSCYFNDRRLQGQQPTGPSPDNDQVLEALGQARFTWLDPTVNPSTHLFVTVMDSLTGPNSLLWQVDADTRYFPPAHIEQIARGMEQMLVKAAFDPATSTGIGTDIGTGIHSHAAQDVQAA